MVIYNNEIYTWDYTEVCNSNKNADIKGGY